MNAHAIGDVLCKLYGSGTKIVDKTPVFGGDINRAYRLALSNGEIVFLKCNQKSRADMFAAEAAGLKALARFGVIAVAEALSYGVAILIDPAVYVGCHEADLAMTELFGGFSLRFYDAYKEVYPLTEGYEERRDLYNLYHLMNHLYLFGSGYLAPVMQIICKYA